jgi:hypothetical protein
MKACHPILTLLLAALVPSPAAAREVPPQAQQSGGKTARRVVPAPSQKILVSRLESGRKQTVITYGTSLTKVGAWTDQLATVLEQNYPGQVTFINSAQGGSNSDWGSRSFDEKVFQNKPDTVFNEYAHGIPGNLWDALQAA